MPYLQKESQGNQYKYVGSSQVLGNVRKKMDEVGLLLVPKVTGHKVSESVIEIKDKDGNTTKRTTTFFTELDMTMTWVNAEKPDEQIECPWYGQGVDIAGEKGVGKALTYAEKYFLLKFFNIATDKDDPDAFQAKHDDKPKKGDKSEEPKINWAGFWRECTKLGFNREEVHKLAGVTSLKDWPKAKVDNLFRDLKTRSMEATLGLENMNES